MSGSLSGATPLFTAEHTAANGSSALGAEVAAFDRLTGLLFVSAPGGVDAIDPETGTIVGTIDTAAYGLVNSVAVRDGVLAIAAEAEPKTDPGTVAVLDLAYAGGSLTATELYTATVGAQPDQISFSPDGALLLTANEGEPSSYEAGGADPEGSVSIVEVATGAVRTAGFAAFDTLDADGNGSNDLVEDGVRVFGPGATVALGPKMRTPAWTRSLVPSPSASSVSKAAKPAVRTAPVATSTRLTEPSGSAPPAR